ncbi:MAG: hypothetical protein K2K84_01885 [Muribaculaceae bacterium]|nr:hypothetical protein [Muribaculaceae bacterium]
MIRLRLLISSFFCLVISLVVIAQDSDKIQLSAYVAPNSGVPQAATKVLESKLRNVITASGFGDSANDRFILTAHVTILTEDVTQTTPPMFAYTLSYNLYIGDGIAGTLFSSTQIEAKGVGQTKDKAYLQALKAINPRDPAIKAFVQEGRQKIIDYFQLNGDAIIREAQTMAANQNFEGAIWTLSMIPAACSELHARANSLMVEFYNQQIAQEGMTMLAEAQSIWNAGHDRDAADRAGAVLAKINPQSPAYAEAKKLSEQIGARIRELDKREWAFELQKEKNKTDIKKAEVQAARDAAVAYAKNQPSVVYHVHWW